MQIVFLNTFEKATEEGGVQSAQLSICEREGVWAILWLEQSGPKPAPDTWFEGSSWEEMIAAFRYGAASRMREGYVPVIDGMLEDRTSASSFSSMLQCYGELHADQELFESLREWRRAKAAALKKSAYLVATNRMLWMISAFVPKTKEELLQIPGWGESKHAAYGEEVLAITAKAERTSGFPLGWVAEKLEPQVYLQWKYQKKEAKHKYELDRQQEKKKILALTQQGGSLDSLQAELDLPRRQIVDRLEQLESEGYHFEKLVEAELAALPESELERIWDAFGKLGDRYLKPVLHEVYGDKPEQDKSIDTMYEKLRLVRLQFRRRGSQAAV
ncbi:HRDC domain-containing protein [Paenibacillus thailandensis]|uniref:HRDC domain-containing protein n=1 Tax=Paenibacillus thailandensis TaxID=393250 RepID=A0ABW5QT14_9BACL